MSAQMTKRGHTKTKGSIYPLWGWVQYEGAELSPLQTYSDMIDEGILLTIEIDDNELLKSDFDRIFVPRKPRCLRRGFSFVVCSISKRIHPSRRQSRHKHG
jgi:hypothetical protein